jgi:hypothetical protein
MVYLELIFAKNSNLFVLFDKTIFSRFDPWLVKKRYGISITSQRGESMFPCIGLFAGTKEKFINLKNFVEEDTLLVDEGPDDIVRRTFTVDGFEYKVKSGYVHTVRKGTNIPSDEPFMAWLIEDELRGKTPLGSLSYISFTDRNGSPLDPEETIRSLLNTLHNLNKMRKAMGEDTESPSGDK